ncbi:hypothetical protein BKA70DRAFT_1464656 [Coprinopsis sp. MPI-PUGE-AT-0042]|nr:hypothetical protein BKA70DRAFT_1464656 [Coprinopsis sp. MPI-PUGE-AT-0042]
MTEHGSVPTEILSEIFRQSLPHRLDQEGRLSFQTIRSVCSRWRAVSFSTPMLWSSISVTCNIGDEGFHDGYSSNLILLGTWFLRAGESIPLELEFSDPAINSMRGEEKEAMKTLIRRYQSRWQLLSLSIDPESFWDVFFDHPPTAWINLHTISLYGYDFLAVASERVAQGLDALEKLHSLRCILLEDCEGYEFTRQFGPLDLQTLHINFDVFGTDQAHLIAAYPYLTTLNLVAPPHLRPELSLQDHITLPFLLSLSYNTYGLSLLDHLYHSCPG